MIYNKVKRRPSNPSEGGAKISSHSQSQIGEKRENTPHSPNRLDLTLGQPVPGSAQDLFRLLGTIERQERRNLLEARERLAQQPRREGRLRREVGEDGADIAV